MAQVTRTGIHYGRLTEIVVKRREDNQKRLQAQLRIFLTAWFSPALKAAGKNPWVDIQAEGQEIIFYGELHGKDGGRNLTMVEMLSTALPWGGKSISELQAIKLDGDGLYIQVDCRLNDFNGKKTIKAEWLHPEAYVAPERAASADDLSAMDLEWASSAASAPKMVHSSGTPARSGLPSK